MRPITPQRRRLAVIAAACAAIIPSCALLMHNTHSNTLDFLYGMIIGVALAISLSTLVIARRTTCN